MTYLILLFTVIPAVELMVLIKVGTYIGAMNTVALIIFTGVVGAFLARMQGLATLYRIQSNLDRGTMPTSEMFDGVLILIGGVLLLTPGFITDTIGLMFLVPLTRTLLKAWLQKKLQTMMARGQIVTITPFRRNNDIYDV
jgi:UPF0716 protein FxsA